MNHDMSRGNAKLVAARYALVAAQVEFNRVCRETVLTCAHDDIAECDSMVPPWRICMNCGLTEEGWGCGYEVLSADSTRIGTIDRGRMLDHRTVSLWQRNYGEPLADRVDDWLNR